MGLANKGFETAGASSGAAQGWTTTVLATLQKLPNFNGGLGPNTPVETFEAGWFNTTFTWFFTPSDVVVVSFNTGLETSPYESFEVQWSNEGYLFALGSAVEATFGGGLSADGFESGWSNDSYLFFFGPGDTTSLVLQLGGDTEMFEEGWDNDTYAVALGAATIVAFDGPVPQLVEDFDHVSPRKAFVASLANDVFVSAAHGFTNGMPVKLKGPGLPNGFAASVLYYVLYLTVDHFQLSLTLGGAAIHLTNEGSGTIFGDPARYWNDVE